jgi:2-polyprenyl-6-hydroxyphenyl methylase/3-demethylubiquinone-9 3-methyltransferase
MDRAWDELGLDASDPDPAALAAFYRHPIWVLNGVFTATDPASVGHRLALVRRLAWANPARILDYGGGFGTLARMLAAAAPRSAIDVFEPYPTATALERAAAYPNLHYVARLNGGYAAVVALDVLEHLVDPLAALVELRDALAPGGLLILANNFYPVIRCHLPGTFYLRYSFDWFARALGLRRLGRIPGAPAVAYRLIRSEPANQARLRRMERLARRLYPALRTLHTIYRAVRRRPSIPL